MAQRNSEESTGVHLKFRWIACLCKLQLEEPPWQGISFRIVKACILCSRHLLPKAQNLGRSPTPALASVPMSNAMPGRKRLPRLPTNRQKPWYVHQLGTSKSHPCDPGQMLHFCGGKCAPTLAPPAPLAHECWVLHSRRGQKKATHTGLQDSKPSTCFGR